MLHINYIAVFSILSLLLLVSQLFKAAAEGDGIGQLGPYLGVASLIFTVIDQYRAMVERHQFRNELKKAKDEQARKIAEVRKLAESEQRNTYEAVVRRIQELEAHVEDSERRSRDNSKANREEIFRHRQNCLLLEDENAKLGRKWRQAQNERNMSDHSFRKYQGQYYGLRDNFDREVAKASHSLQDELEASKQREGSLQQQIKDVTAEKDRYWKAGCELYQEKTADAKRYLDQASTDRETAQRTFAAKDAVADGLRGQVQQLANASGIQSYKQKLAADSQQEKNDILQQAQGHADTVNAEKQTLRTERDQALQAKGIAETQASADKDVALRLQSQAANVNSQLKTASDQLKTTKDQKAQVERSLRSELAACQGLRDDKTRLEANVQQLDNTLKAERGNVGTLVAERDSLKTERDSLTNERDAVAAERKTLATQRKRLFAENAQLEQKAKAANQKTMNIIVQGGQASMRKTTEINGKDKEIAELRARVKQLEAMSGAAPEPDDLDARSKAKQEAKKRKFTQDNDDSDSFDEELDQSMAGTGGLQGELATKRQKVKDDNFNQAFKDSFSLSSSKPEPLTQRAGVGKKRKKPAKPPPPKYPPGFTWKILDAGDDQ